MKKSILSIIIASIALVSFNIASAQKANPHFNKTNPPTVTGSYITSGANTEYQVCASGIVYGNGNASSVQAYLKVEGSATTECKNGGQDAGPVSGQTSFSTQSPTQTFPATNGNANFSLCTTLIGSCKGQGSGWSSAVANVIITKVTLYVNGSAVDLTTYFVAQ